MLDLDHLMRGAIVVIAAGGFSSFLMVFLHAWAAKVDHRRYGRSSAMLRGRLLRSVGSPGADAGLARELVRLPVRHRTRLLAEVGRMLQGSDRGHVTRLARATGVVAHAVRLTRRRAWWRRLHGVRVLIAVGGGERVVPELLADAHPLVRSEAAAWCGRNPDPERIRRLLNLMDTPTMVDRFAVIDALVAIGPPAVLPLAKRLTSCTTEGRRAGLTAALGMADPVFLPAASQAACDADVEVRVRAARLLSILGGEQAMDVLVDLLDDRVPRVRAAAARGLGRCGAWSAAGELELLLADPQADPRRDAALALADLGPAGWLLLRETARLGGPAGRLADAVLESLWSPGEPLDLTVGRLPQRDPGPGAQAVATGVAA